MSGISALGAYLPRLRLERSSIASAMQWMQPDIARMAKGKRTLGYWDEDAITMAVEACRSCLGPSFETKRAPVPSLFLASDSLPFAQPQNATLVAAALRLAEECRTHDVSGTPRAALVALHELLEGEHGGLIAAADRIAAPAGSRAEMTTGDGAAAVAVTSGDGACLTYLGGASTTVPFVEEYREPDSGWATHWEERWIRDQGVLKLVPACVEAACKAAGIGPAEVNWLVMPSTIAKADNAVARASGLTGARMADNLAGAVGDCGTAQPFLMLAQAANDMVPGEIVVLAGFGQGATALVFRAGEDVRKLGQGIADQLSDGVADTNYAKLPVFSGLLAVDAGIRARTANQEALSVAYRYAEALLGFVGGRCDGNGEVMFPPSRLSLNSPSPSLDTQKPWPLADRKGIVASGTRDSLAYSPHPPSCYGLVDFDGGGRLMMDFTDVDAPLIRTGDEVRFVFRLKDQNKAIGFHRYFWKATRASGSVSMERGE